MENVRNVVQIEGVDAQGLKDLIVSTIEEVKEAQRRKALPSAQNMRDLMNGYLTRKEVAELLRVSTVTIDKWSNAGILTKYRLGGRIRFKKSEVEANLDKVKSLKYKRGIN